MSRKRPAFNRLNRVASRASARLSADWGSLFQGAAAAAVAWVIAKYAINHHEPFFAPMAAFIGLNTSLGERGTNSLRLLVGVLIGLVAGQLTVLVLGRGYGSIALAVFVATAVARAASGARIIIANAATSAILAVAVVGSGIWQNRLVDALIGAGVALVFSQFLFSPEPVAFVRRAMASTLAEMANGLSQTAQALATGDQSLLRRAMDRQRELRARMSDLHRVKNVSTNIARHSVVWTSEGTPLPRETRSAEHLDFLGGSCLMLMRLAMATRPENQPRLAPCVRILSILLEDLSLAPEDIVARQRVAQAALAVARGIIDTPAPPESTLSAALTAARVVASDIMIFAGISPTHVTDAVREGTLGPS